MQTRLRLSAREREVMEYLCTGLQTKEIAMLLGISARTVDVHRGHILRELHSHSMTQAMVALSDLGLLTDLISQGRQNIEATRANRAMEEITPSSDPGTG